MACLISILDYARTLFEQTPHWSVFYMRIFGPEGSLFRAFPNEIDRNNFRLSVEYTEIMKLFQELFIKSDIEEKEETLTIKIPAPIHSALRRKASEKGLSFNRLCAERLLGN
jgi:hypothetical protein